MSDFHQTVCGRRGAHKAKLQRITVHNIDDSVATWAHTWLLCIDNKSFDMVKPLLDTETLAASTGVIFKNFDSNRPVGISLPCYPRVMVGVPTPVDLSGGDCVPNVDGIDSVEINGCSKSM